MSATPRTDAAEHSKMKPIEDEWVPDFDFVPSSLSREFERENAKLRGIVRAAYLHQLDKLDTLEQKQLGRDLATYGTNA